MGLICNFLYHLITIGKTLCSWLFFHFVTWCCTFFIGLPGLLVKFSWICTRHKLIFDC
jgi:hypothetical protein